MKEPFDEDKAELKKKIFNDTIHDMKTLFRDRDLNPGEQLAVLGVGAAAVLLENKMHGALWTAYMSSMVGTIISNADMSNMVGVPIFVDQKAD